MTSLYIAYDIVREAFARRYVVWMLVGALFGSGMLLMGLNLDVVDGALAATQFFGMSFSDAIVPLDVALRPILSLLAGAVFHLSIFFGILALPDLVLRVLHRDRVLSSLALPLRRFELILGAFFGGLIFYSAIVLLLLTSLSLIFYLKASLPPWALVGPLLWSALGFMPMLAALLAFSVVVESTTLTLGVGWCVYSTMLVMSEPSWLLGDQPSKLWQFAGSILLAPLPRLSLFQDMAIASINRDPLAWSDAGPAMLACLLFTAGLLVFAVILLDRKDF